ncbi:beta family protein [Psychrobacter sp. 1U2]|uniref:beta family protein n=1 Tax=Psychrobacter sp. 1U2 TaxID=3453577 RepID=UPI003F460C9E
MILSNSYVPFLKWRQSEFQALFKLEDEIKDFIIPYIILPPIEYDFAERRLKKTIEEHIEPMAKRIYDKWGSRLALLDFHDSLEGKVMDNGESVVEYVHNEALALGCELVPVVSFEKSNWYLVEVKKITSAQKCGIALRVFLEDLDRQTINNEIDYLLEMFDLGISNIDLIIDLGTPDNFEPYALFSHIIFTKINSINNIKDYRSFVIVANSLDLMQIKQPGGVFTRHEWMLYPYLASKFKETPPTFGDYTTDNIEFLPQIDMRKINPSAKLIYTLPQHWHVLKAKAFRGSTAQMINLCSNIISLPDYKGIAFCDGDKRIYDTAKGIENCGNLGTWKQVAINHHMTKVVHQLSSYHASII